MTKDKLFIEKLRKNHSLVTTRNLFFDASKQMDLNFWLAFTGSVNPSQLSYYSEKKLLETQDSFGNNLLHMAELVGCEHIAVYLCGKAPGLIEQQNNFGQYPIHFASFHPNHLQKYPSCLLQKTDTIGFGLLHVVCARGILENIDFLLARCPVIDKPHKLGGLPMHCLMNHYDPSPRVKKNKVFMGKKLIKHLGPKIANRQLKQRGLIDMSPLDWAEETMTGKEIDELFQV